MEIIAQANQVRISPRKVRLVADAVRRMSLDEALYALRSIRKRGARVLEKTILSAVANAVNNAKLERSKLKIARIEVTEGPAFKRYRASTRGRIHPYKKRSSNIKVVLQEVTNGTKS
ncbi:MAG: 50S ribosomal protein L22 [Patescibacteria group bacterium]|nr:MAG: 50S ribosomal protein L22 [Patescibacteria group bacterium]